MRKHQRGFTLVELLVVVAILALLISILLPALGRARAVATRTQCAANMHQMITAMLGYSNETKGKLWPFNAPYDMKGANNGPAFSRTQFTLNAVDGKTDGTGPMTGVAYGKIRNCPGADNTNMGSYSYQPHPGVGGKATTGGIGDPVTYNWTGTAAQPTVPRWTTMTRHPKDRILLVDVVRDGNVNHLIGKEGSWNMAFVDGSVRTVASSVIVQKLNITSQQVTPNGAESWHNFNDVIRVLELLKDNKDPKLSTDHKYLWPSIPAIADTGGTPVHGYWMAAWQNEPIGPFEIY